VKRSEFPFVDRRVGGPVNPTHDRRRRVAIGIRIKDSDAESILHTTRSSFKDLSIPLSFPRVFAIRPGSLCKPRSMNRSSELFPLLFGWMDPHSESMNDHALRTKNFRHRNTADHPCRIPLQSRVDGRESFNWSRSNKLLIP
jgi:hypothetical protein